MVFHAMWKKKSKHPYEIMSSGSGCMAGQEPERIRKCVAKGGVGEEAYE